MPIRDDFPLAESNYMDGTSDGWEYRLVFSGVSLEQSYAMIQAFLEEEGYADIPIPESAEELALFRLPTRNQQILLFEDNGYVHNPIKILFPENRRQKRAVTLCIYNEKAPNHLLRFHNIKKRVKKLKSKAKKKKKASTPPENPMAELDFDAIVFEPAFVEVENFGE